MRRRRFPVLLLLAAFLVAPFRAEAGADQSPDQADTRIEADDEADIIRFIVAGREVARLTSEGLIVRDDLRFGGMTEDIGDENYDAATAPKKPEGR